MNAACRATPVSPGPQSDRPMADGLPSQEGRPQPARRAGWAKPSPAAPSLKPLACRPEGGKSLPRLLFSAICKSRASEVRQARRADPCGQGLRRCGHVVKALPCPHVHAGGALVHQADTGGRVVLLRVGGLGGGKRCNQGAECRRRLAGAAPRGQPHGRAGVAGHHGGRAPHPPVGGVQTVRSGSMARRELYAVLCRVGFKVVKSGAHPIHFPHQPANIRTQRGHQRYRRGGSAGEC